MVSSTLQFFFHTEVDHLEHERGEGGLYACKNRESHGYVTEVASLMGRRMVMLHCNSGRMVMVQRCSL